MNPSRCRVLIPGLVLALLLVPALTWALAAESDSPAGADMIRKALNQTTDMEFVDITLREALANLRDKTKLNIIVDEQGVAAETLDSATKANLRRVSLRSGLNALLGQYNLAYVILGDVLLITNKEQAMDRQLQQLVNVDLNNVPLTTALKKLARETATNLVVDPRVAKEAQTTPLTMQLEDVPLEMAVRIMAEAAAGLKPARLRNVLFVTNENRANELEADPSTKTPAQLQKMLEEEAYILVPSEQGGVKLVPRAGPGCLPAAAGVCCGLGGLGAGCLPQLQPALGLGAGGLGGAPEK